MRPMTEMPELFGVRVVLYLKDEERHGWVGKIPGWNDDERAFAEQDQYDEYPDGYTHGFTLWGSPAANPRPSTRYLGWDYDPPTIEEEPDVGDLLAG